MTHKTKNALKAMAYELICPADSTGRPPRAIKMGGQEVPAANDTLYDELEARYGGGFAQWVVDRVAHSTAREKAK
ncbi:MAG: hypothetical protein OXT65_09500 [Alphaproteobacteria bacterium]|nr:hypothetical protein [Alphaproteobacteria bacterium]